MGRPFKLTAEISQQILQAMRNGNYRCTAAALAGVTDNTVENWLARGEKALASVSDPKDIPEPEAIFAAFALAFRRIEAEVESESVVALRTGRDDRNRHTDRKGHLKFLERRFPDRWGNRKAIEHTGSLELNHQAKVVVLPGINGPINDTMATEPGTTDAISPEQRK